MSPKWQHSAAGAGLTPRTRTTLWQRHDSHKMCGHCGGSTISGGTITSRSQIHVAVRWEHDFRRPTRAGLRCEDNPCHNISTAPWQQHKIRSSRKAQTCQNGVISRLHEGLALIAWRCSEFSEIQKQTRARLGQQDVHPITHQKCTAMQKCASSSWTHVKVSDSTMERTNTSCYFADLKDR